MATRSGLVVDFGGVLTSDVFASFSAFCAAEGLSEDAVRQAFGADPVGRELLFGLELGHLEESEFERRLSARLGLDAARAHGLIDRLFGGMRPDREMEMAVVAAKRQGIRTGLLSNSWGTARYEVERFPDLFDAWVISGEVGLRKPDPAIYELTCERVGLPPSELVYVDDLAGNLKPAAEMGFATVLHRSAAETIPQVEDLLGVKLGR